MNEGVSVPRATEPRRWGLRSVAVATIAAGALILPAGVAQAHESREVGGLTLVVGWSGEPAYAGFGNEVFVSVTRGDRPVEDGELEAEVVFGEGGASTQVALDPSFSTPNEYLGYIIPTRPGTYTFNVSGTVGGETIEETFTSGPDTFNDVQNPADAEFPEQDPTRGEIAEALDRLSGRIEGLGAQEPAEDSDVALWVAVGAGVLALIAVVLAARRRAA